MFENKYYFTSITTVLIPQLRILIVFQSKSVNMSTDCCVFLSPILSYRGSASPTGVWPPLPGLCP